MAERGRDDPTASRLPSGQAGTDRSSAWAEKLRRRIARLRRGGMLDSRAAGATVERATTLEALKAAYELVHQVYVEKGYIVRRDRGLRVRVFEALPDMATFVACIDGDVAAVTSVVTDSEELGLPSDHVFSAEIAALRDEAPPLCEITNLAVAPAYRSTPVFMQLTQACFAHALRAGCGNLFIAISPGHTRFFHDVLQFEPFGTRRSYSTEVDDPVEGMRLRLTDSEARARAFDALMGSEAFLHAYYFGDNEYHQRVDAWNRQAAALFGNPEQVQELFLFCSELLFDCSDEELEALEHRWGPGVFWSVWGEPEVAVDGLRGPKRDAGRTTSSDVVRRTP